MFLLLQWLVSDLPVSIYTHKFSVLFSPSVLLRWGSEGVAGWEFDGQPTLTHHIFFMSFIWIRKQNTLPYLILCRFVSCPLTQILKEYEEKCLCKFYLPFSRKKGGYTLSILIDKHWILAN